MYWKSSVPKNDDFTPTIVLILISMKGLKPPWLDVMIERRDGLYQIGHDDVGGHNTYFCTSSLQDPRSCGLKRSRAKVKVISFDFKIHVLCT
jgi:hypothetical protein